MAVVNKVRKGNLVPDGTGESAGIGVNSAGQLVYRPGTTDIVIGTAAGAQFSVTVPLSDASVDTHIFTADSPVRVVAVRVVESVLGGTGAAVVVERTQGTEAPGAGDDLTAAIDLEDAVAANVVQDIAVLTAADINLLAAGDRVSLDFSGTLTAMVGSITVVLAHV